jgi:lysophospholipase L1-like esterase
MPFPFLRPRAALVMLTLAGKLAWAAAPAPADSWVATWAAAPAGPVAGAKALKAEDQTLRLIVHTSSAGRAVRIRLSNEMGAAALAIGEVHVALRAQGARTVPGSSRELTFSGNRSIVIPPGAPAVSDPVDFAVPAMADLAISIHLPGSVTATTVHGAATQTNYLSRPGNHAGATDFPVQDQPQALQWWPLLTEVDVDAGPDAGTIVTLGDSITDGFRSRVDANGRWPDWLARRLHEAGKPRAIANRGIAGNRLLTDPPAGSSYGRNALERFDRDLGATSGVRWMTVLLGINDICQGTPDDPVGPEPLIAAHRQLIARAHAHGIRAFGATLTPFGGNGCFSPRREEVRQALNAWIRNGGEYDGVIDFDRVVADPADPTRMLKEYDSGDHLHPGDKGYEAMGRAVPLALFGVPATQNRP